MRAMTLSSCGGQLVGCELQLPALGANEVLVKVRACGVCRTDLHIVDGDLPDARWPVVPGHEIVGMVEKLGPAVADIVVGDHVGIPWLGQTCGTCLYCASGRENLCEHALFTGYTRNGGYAEYVLANAHFCFKLPPLLDAVSAAPLMCAGLIGWRSLSMVGDADKLGIYGFGAAGHIIAQIAVQQGRDVYAFTRPGDKQTQTFALDLGAKWAGDSNVAPPEPLDASIIFASVGDLVPLALSHLDKGGTLVCGGIHMSDIPSFPYSYLWHERVVRSVANLTRQDGIDFMAALQKYRVETTVHRYALADANVALDDLRHGRFDGAAVLVPPDGSSW